MCFQKSKPTDAKNKCKRQSTVPLCFIDFEINIEHMLIPFDYQVISAQIHRKMFRRGDSTVRIGN